MGNGLVVAQFGLLLLQAALALPEVLQGAMGLGWWVTAAACLALAVWTLRHNQLGNFNIRPVPKHGASLVTSGPYRWIRHPMYSTLLLGAAALAWLSEPLAGWLCWSGLALVLLLKSSLEEKWMRQKHAGYASYAGRSKRFVPWLF